MGGRVFVWLGGGLFAGALTVCAWCYLFVMGRAIPPAGWQPVAADAALLTLFVLHHSLFARDRIKDWLARHIRPPLMRSLHVWVASALLMLACFAWRRIGGEIYTVGGAAALLLAAVQIAGLGIT